MAFNYSYTPNPTAVNPLNKTSSPAPNFTTTTGQNVYKPPTTPFVIAGLKPTQPGNISKPTTNTLSKSQTAPISQQKVTSTTPPPLVNPNAGFQTQGLLGNQQSGVPQAKTTLPDIPTGPNYNLGQNPNDPYAGTSMAGRGTVDTGGSFQSTLQQATNNQNQQSPQPPAPPSTTSSGPTAPSLLSKVAGFAGGDPGLTDLYQKQQALNADFASKQASILNTPQELNFQTGRLAALQSEYEAAKADLANTYQANLAQRGQNIGAAESALGTTMQFQSSPYGQPLINPATGQVISGGQPLGQGGNLDPQTQANQLAQDVINGKTTYAQALSSMGYVGSVGPTFLNQAITQAGGDPLKLQAQGAATQQNIQTGGTAGVSAANTGYQQAVQDYGSMSATNNSAEAQITQVKNVLAQTGINQGIPAYNQAINTLQTQLGGTAYTQLVTSITELQNMYSQLLSAAGTTPTGSESQAVALLNPSSSAAQINASIQQLQTAAYNRLTAQYGKMQTFQSNLGGTNTQNATTNQSAGITWDTL